MEAAEEAHLKHEFDADLQVTDFYFELNCWCVSVTREECFGRMVPGRHRLLPSCWARVAIIDFVLPVAIIADDVTHMYTRFR